jgi:hypothetical protein
VVVKGSGFRGERARYRDTLRLQIRKSGITADSDGIFQTTVIVPNAAMGTHDIGAKGQYTSSGSVDEVEFEVEPTITIDPSAATWARR